VQPLYKEHNGLLTLLWKAGKLLSTFTAEEETCRFPYRQLPSSSIRQLNFRSCAELLDLFYHIMVMRESLHIFK
jgi:hypothetical protein